MSVASPTFNQIRAKVTAIQQKRGAARVIGISSPAPWTGGRTPLPGNQELVIHQCDSPLAFRIALREPVGDHVTKVVLTPLDEKGLSDDILVRLEGRKLFHLDVWETVRMLFHAREVDPRVAGQRWMAESLLELMPPAGYPTARGGFLDAETAWGHVLRLQLGLDAERPDLTAILRWSTDRHNVARFAAASAEFRAGTIAWLEEQAGAAVRLILSSIGSWESSDAISVGLVAVVLGHPGPAGELDRSIGKFEERFLSGQTPAVDQLQRWSAAATEAVRALRHTSERLHYQTLRRTDQILRELRADSWAHVSDTSPLGFDQRLRRFGERLSGICAAQAWSGSVELDSIRQSIREHDEATREVRRMTRINMALRLVNWLASPAASRRDSLQSLGDAATEYARNGGFVDWARLSLRAGDPVAELSSAYLSLFEAVTAVRERQNAEFARLLGNWTATGSVGTEVIPVERVLDEIVVPLAKGQPVLLIVVDGMSMAVYRELAADLLRQEWMPLREPGRAGIRPGLAAIPSVTEYSRTSLLTGQLQAGNAATETAGFARHQGLLDVSRASHPPVLFHKASLEETGDVVLSPDVRDAIRSAHRRVVGVVVNAVDDNLRGGEQIDLRWSREEIRVLPPLLYEARQAGRLVILVSDHGHIVDCHTQSRQQLAEEGGERWIPANRSPESGEVVIEGSRVLRDGRRLIAPASERLRYSGKKNGYHGGVTLQEMVTPIVVLSSAEPFPKGWTEHPVETPDWWDGSASVVQRIAIPMASESPSWQAAPGRLFHPETMEPRASLTNSASPESPWIDSLLSSEVFQQQKRLAGRGIPDDAILTRLLTSLEVQGGKLTLLALARFLEMPEMRLPGLLAKVQRILNVDGYPVLNRDEPSQTVELNRGLLITQFGLEQE